MKKKIGISILIILILVIIVYFSVVIRRFVIINQIKNANKDYLNSSNYHIIINNERKSENIDGENNETKIVEEFYSNEIFYLENSYKQIVNNSGNVSENLTYLVDLDSNIYFRFDKSTLRKELINLSDLPEKVDISNLTNYNLVSEKNSINILNALNIFSYHIASDENNYIIKYGEVEEHINKDTKLLYKQINYFSENSYNIIEYAVEFDNVTVQDVNEV